MMVGVQMAQRQQQQQRRLSGLEAQIHPPPSIPLPPLPAMRKMRAVSGLDEERRGPQARAVTAIPSPKSTSTTSVPTLKTLAPSPSAHNLRKTVSIEAFPRPPNRSPRSNSPMATTPQAPASASAAASASAPSPAPAPAPAPAISTPTASSNPLVAINNLRRPQSKTSVYGLRHKSSSPALVANSSRLAGPRSTSESLLSIPSPPLSRSSSAPGSPATTTDGTTVDDMDDSDALAKETKGNIIVSVRVRPDAANDGHSDGEWMVDGRRSLISYDGGEYRYDNVFSPHDQNARVYESAAKRLVRRVMEGYHGTVFAYGMTGTGKTFSMQGTAISPGVIPLAITDIFSYIRQNPAREFLLRVSYLEIYNEKIHDLLNPQGAQSEEIKLREDPRRGVYATPLKEEIVQSPNQLLRVIARGDQQRRVSSTQFNARSSRSHAVVQIVVESRERSAAPVDERRQDKLLPGGVLVSTLSLIDLAGSEKAAENKERRTEGGHINKSLLTLGTVIARLSGDKELSEKDQKHLPYRDSKLTRLLQPALSGNSLVSILCTVQLSSAASSAAASTSHTSETLNTMKFASRAKNNLVSHAKRNESNPAADGADPKSRALLDRYKLEIIELRNQLEVQNKLKHDAENAEDEEERWRERERESAERHEEQMLEMQLARTALKERISHLNRLILSSKSLGVNSGRFSSASSNVPVLQRSSTQSISDPLRSRPPSRGSQGKMSRVVSAGSTISGTLPVARTSQVELASASEDDEDDEDDEAEEEDEEEGEEEYDDLAVSEDSGNASSARRIRALQADLADKNMYIATLEKRLLQARHGSRGRTSAARSPALSPSLSYESHDVDSVVRDKDREIDELKAKLDDQARMVSALRNSARKRDMLDSVGDLSQHPAFRQDPTARQSLTPRHSISRPELVRSVSSNSRLSFGSLSPVGSMPSFSRAPTNPVSLLTEQDEEEEKSGATSPKTGVSPESSMCVDKVRTAPVRKNVDEMTKLLDEMIQDKVESGHVLRGERGSLRVKRDTVMSRKDDAREAEEGAASQEKML